MKIFASLQTEGLNSLILNHYSPDPPNSRKSVGCCSLKNPPVWSAAKVRGLGLYFFGNWNRSDSIYHEVEPIRYECEPKCISFVGLVHLFGFRTYILIYLYLYINIFDIQIHVWHARADIHIYVHIYMHICPCIVNLYYIDYYIYILLAKILNWDTYC